MSEHEDADRTAGRDPADPQRPDPYERASRHDPAFPSWRYAGLRWLAERLYRDGRGSD